MRSTFRFGQFVRSRTTRPVSGLLSAGVRRRPAARPDSRAAALQQPRATPGAPGPRPRGQPQRPAQAAPQAAEPQTRRLTIEEAVKLALENNLGIQIARFDPQVEDLTVVAGPGRVVADA